MGFFSRQADRLMNLVFSIRDRQLAWHSENHERLLALKQAEAAGQQAITAELAVKSEQLAHEIALMQARHKMELAMLKTRCQSDLSDYRDYLQSLADLKTLIQRTYAHLPASITLTIHHHAKSLLHEMWDTVDPEEKFKLEVRFLQFMTTVHEEAATFTTLKDTTQLPNDTLKMIRREKED